MILATPIQIQEIEAGKSTPIREVYADYEETFVILHPFLKVKEGYDVRFDTWKRPTKNDIFNGTLPVNWSEIVAQANLKDIKELDRLLAYLHGGRFEAEKDAWLRLMRYVDSNKLYVAQTDDYPSVLINPTLEVLKVLGYNDVLCYSDISNDKTSYNISGLLTSGNNFPGSNARILTPDNKIILVTDFDLRFSYLSSDQETLDFFLSKINLEGFYCNATTRPGWSHELSNEDMINWKSSENKNYY
ncbi:MAG: DUF2711 family protein [Flavobacterium sp.]|nr:MAG: DUF2711 family protein [Flavobacterium sp.]